MDVSDCCVGRFKTEDLQEEVIASFEMYAEERGKELSKQYLNEESEPAQLGLPFFSGWISF